MQDWLIGIIGLLLCCLTIVGVCILIQWKFPIEEEVLFVGARFRVVKRPAFIWQEWGGVIGCILGGIVGILYYYLHYRILCWREHI